MTAPADDLLPPEFDTWPRSVQRRYITELHALYFPEAHEPRRMHPASTITAAIPQPGDDDVVDAEIVD